MAAKSLRPLLHGSRSLSLAPQPCGRSQLLPFLVPCIVIRNASGLSLGQKARESAAATKKKKARAHFIRPNTKDAEQFALCDAMRYLRAFEVGRSPTSAKYELAVSMRTLKNGPVVRNRLRLPHAVDTSQRICVICPPDSPAAAAAIKAGASVVGEETVFDAIREGRIEFERCICHVDSHPKLVAANLGRMLGPKGLMPSLKMGTVIKDVAAGVRSMVGGSEYREKIGVIRLAIGQLGFTPEEMQRNIQAFMTALKKDLTTLDETINKEICEVVLSSTSGPGFPLSGEFATATSIPSRDLTVN